MKVNVVVFHTASKKIEVEVPDSLLEGITLEREIERDAEVLHLLEDHIQKMLDEDLPEIHEGSTFEFATGFQLEGSDHEVDLG